MLLFLELFEFEDPLLDVCSLPRIQLVPVDFRVLATDGLGWQPTDWVVHVLLWFVEHSVDL